jgi:type II secretory pathway pseudopilin PulG
MIRQANNSGFTLVEVIVATTILMLAMGMAMSGFLYVLTNSRHGDIQDELDSKLQVAMERLKRDLRLSSLDEMAFYKPTNETEFTAISFPLARDDDGNGAIELGTNGLIDWDVTLVYHVWKAAPSQLRLTTFDPRDDTLTDEEREAQIECVVTNGNGTLAQNGSNSTMTVIFVNLFDWTITPIGSSYDAYAPSVTRDVNVTLGSLVLSNGTHEFKFTVEGSNRNSTGYALGLDSFVVSPCGAKREAEAQLVSDIAGPAVTTDYMAGGSWDGNHQLEFPADAVDQYVTLTMNNDRWEETHFRGTGALHDDTTMEFDQSLSPKDYIIRLDGETNSGWFAYDQTGDPNPWGMPDPDQCVRNCAVRVLLKGSDMESGGYIPYNSGASIVVFQGGGAVVTERLEIQYVSIAEAASSQIISPDINLATLTTLVVPSVMTSSNFGYALLPDYSPPIDKSKSYIVSYLVAFATPKGYARYWTENNDASGRGCWILPGGTVADLEAANWSGNTNVIVTNRLYGVMGLATYYPSNGVFTSQIFDTHLTAPNYQTIGWNVDLNGGSFAMRIRSGNNSDMSDATAWTNISAIGIGGINPGDKRYIQFQPELKAGGPRCNFTPKLKDVTIAWEGETKLVDVNATLTKGPDYGTFKLTVDGEELTTGVGIDLEIYKDVFGFSDISRITSELTAEIEPRNTGR